MAPQRWLASLAVLSAFVVRWGESSVGDMSRNYCDCLAECYSGMCGVCGGAETGDRVVCPDHCARNDAWEGSCGRFRQLQPKGCYWNPEADVQTVPWAMRAMGWTCAGECKYTCARADAKARAEEGTPVVQYHGKWPFQRVWGAEEIVSVVASVGNAVPHVAALWSSQTRAAFAPRGHPQREALLVYALVGLNAWVWSSCLHWKETWATERLDYHSASLLVLAGAWLCACRTLGLRSRRGVGLGLAGCLVAFWLAWVWYMNFVLFDYGLNMKVAVGISVVANIAWCVWGAMMGCGAGDHKRAWQAPAAAVALSAAGLLELLDFSPVLFDLVDPHSLWHIATIPLGFFMYDFLRYDAGYVMRAVAKKSKDAAAV